MIESTNLKNGTTFLLNGDPYKVIKYTLIKMGRGGATVKVNCKNLKNGSLEDRTFSSNVKVEEVVTVKRKLQYLYKNTDTAYFMDPKTFEQIEVPLSTIGEELVYVREGDNVDLLFWGDMALSIDIPPKVTMKVVEAAPGVKGNSASNVTKLAVLENGKQVRVPLFIEKGESIRVDTRTGEYVERVK